jgi:toxin-antitoxin system PIN domain toxin
MTSYLIDINVWLAVTWDLHPQHGTASRWYAAVNESNDSALLFCRLTMLGFLRLLTNRTVMGDSTVTLNSAIGLYDRWIEDPRVELMPEPRQIDKLFRQALSAVATQPATKAVADCYLIGFAAAAGAHIVTLDKGLAGMAKMQKVPFALIRPA